VQEPCTKHCQLGGSKIENLSESAELCLDGIFKNTLDSVPAGSMMNVYCNCGRIVWLDRSSMILKLSMGKSLECMQCRNRRISEEIDSVDRHFRGEDEVSAEY
jgi:hypothetical protein